jgi:purine-nucleoside phosphorylase
MMSTPLPFDQTLSTIHKHIPASSPLRSPEIGIICGSGLGGLVGSMRDVVRIGYEELGFSQSTVQGHAGALAFGFIGEENVPTVAMLGRLHFYEGHSLRDVTYPVRVMARLGIKNLIITNAAGSLNPLIDPGTIVVIRDHLALPSLTGTNPLLGPLTHPSFPRVLPLSTSYSPHLQRLAHLSAHDLNASQSTVDISIPTPSKTGPTQIPTGSHANQFSDSQKKVVDLAEGTYAWVSGPTYESIAEGRALRSLGADVVGMSTVPEVVVAREENVQVLVLSLVTNLVVIPDGYRSIKEEVQAEVCVINFYLFFHS